MSRPSGPPPLVAPGAQGTTPNPRPPVPQQQYQVKPPSTQYFPPASAHGSAMPPGTPFQGQNTQTYLPSQAFTPTSFGAGWQGSVLSTFGADGPPTGDSARMQAAEGLAPPGWETARQIAALQVKLDRQLGPEFISQRSGQGGAKFTYIEGWKLINIANEIFGFNGWSSSILALDIDFIDTDAQGRHTVGVTARVRVTLRDGAYHEDCGYGSMANSRDKAAALEKCKKEAVTDALKRALRSFGNVLGNCLYDKTYESKIKTVKSAPATFDEKQLYRRPEFDTYNSRAGIITDPTEAPPMIRAMGSTDPFATQASTASYAGGSAAGSPGLKAWQAPNGGAGPPSLARTAMANANTHGSHLQQRAATTTTAPAHVARAQTTPSRPPQKQEPLAASSSQPEGVSEMDLSAVDFDASAYDSFAGFDDDGAGGLHSAPRAAAAAPARAPQQQQQQQQPSAATTTTTAASNSGPPPMKHSAPSSTTSNPGAAARAASIAAGSSKVGGFSFPGADKPNADGPPPGVNPGAWKRQQSVMNLNRASTGRPLSAELESVQGTSGSAPKRQKVEYGGQQV